MGDSRIGVRRLAREYAAILQGKGLAHIAVKPENDNLLVWHFVLHSLPDDTPYHNGVYHGKLVFPNNYPFAPPSILMLTATGRFKSNYPLCFSNSSYHPESWNPAWRVETILTGFLSFMLDAADPAAAGSVRSSDEEKRRLALLSKESNIASPLFRSMFPEFCTPPTNESRSGSGTLKKHDDDVATAGSDAKKSSGVAVIIQKLATAGLPGRTLCVTVFLLILAIVLAVLPFWSGR